jgi:hypothetical protein
VWKDSVVALGGGGYGRIEVIRMRRTLLVLTAGFLCPAFAAWAVPLCSYQSPLTDLSNLTISFSYDYHNDPYGLEEHDVNSGEFTVDYVRLYDKPEYGFDINLRNQMVISAVDVSSYLTDADGNYKRYFSEAGRMFAFAGATAKSSSSFQALGVSVNAGIGTGRFTDVTPLATATRINDYLVKRGSLEESMHPVDLQILAYEIGSVGSYDTTADLLAVVQEIIEGSGQVRSGGLDALDISKITELIQDEGFSRYCGWDLKIGLGYELLDPSGGENDLLVTGGFNYAFTTTPSVQFLVQGTISGPPALLEQNRIDLTASYDLLLSGFLSLKAAYDFSRETWAGVATDTHQISLDVSVQPFDSASVVLSVVLEHRPYYLEWNVDVGLSISMELL